MSIEFREKNLGLDHPILATGYSNLAMVEQAADNAETAIQLFGKAHELADLRLGPEHPITKGIKARLDATSDK